MPNRTAQVLWWSNWRQRAETAAFHDCCAALGHPASLVQAGLPVRALLNGAYRVKPGCRPSLPLPVAILKWPVLPASYRKGYAMELINPRSGPNILPTVDLDEQGD